MEAVGAATSVYQKMFTGKDSDEVIANISFTGP